MPCEVTTLDPNKPCGRESYSEDEKGFCILHSNIEDKSEDSFRIAIRGILYEPQQEHDFGKVVFPKNCCSLSTIHFEKRCFFTDARFLGNADFQYTRFKDNAYFGGVEFHGQATFLMAVFEKDTSFIRAKFMNYAYFNGNTQVASFQGEVYFDHVKFCKRAFFRDATFEKKASFLCCRFFENAYFNKSSFFSEADFSEADFVSSGKHIELPQEVKLPSESSNKIYYNPSDKLLIVQGQMSDGERDRLLGVSQNNKYNDAVNELFKITDWKDIQFRETTLEEPEQIKFLRTNLSRTSFLDTDVSKIDFTGAIWPKREGRNALFDEINLLKGRGPARDYVLVEKTYRQLKTNYEDKRDFILAGDFYFGEMELVRAQQKKFSDRLFMYLYKRLSGYGEDCVLPLRWSLGIILFTALLLLHFGITCYQNTSLGTCLLYSLQTFTFVTEREWIPLNKCGTYLSTFESICGPIFITLFIIAFRRRFRR